MPPFVIDKSSDLSDPIKAGFEMAIVNAFAGKFNFTACYVECNFTVWGDDLVNGRTTGILGEVQDGNVDYTMGRMYLDYSKSMYFFEGVLQFLTYYDFWYVPTAREKLRWMNLFLVFQPHLWIAVVSSIFVVGIIWWSFLKIKNNSTQSPRDSSIDWKIFVYIERSWKILLQVSVALPSNTTVRLITISWIFLSILINTAYQSKLISIINKPQFEHQISTFDEMIKSDLKIGTTMVVKSYMKKDPKYDSIWDRFVDCPYTEACLNRTAFQRDIAVMKTNTYADYMSKKFYMDQKGKSRIFAIKDLVANKFFPTFILRKGHPLKDKFQIFVLRLHSNGLIDKWYKKITSNPKEIESIELFSLSLYDVLCAFLILVFGLLISLLVFTLEVLFT